MFNFLASAMFHTGTNGERTAFYIDPKHPFPQLKETGGRFHVNGITVNKNPKLLEARIAPRGRGPA